MIQNKLKDQRGFTLIELLAVIVILGIVSAIAVPSVGGIIKNTKIDAHIANAQQVADAARLYVTSENKEISTTATTIMLNTLIASGNLSEIKDPSGTDNNSYNINEEKGSKVTVVKNGNNIEYRVTLLSAGETPNTYISAEKDASKLTRKDVTLPQ